MTTTLVLGIGNPDRGDDGAGVAVARAVTGARVEELRDCSTLIARWANEERVVVVDAMKSGAEPGTITEIDGLREQLGTGTFPSTHSFGLAESLELARVTGRLPGSLIIYAIEGERFEHGHGLTPAVEEAVHEVLALIERDLS